MSPNTYSFERLSKQEALKICGGGDPIGYKDLLSFKENGILITEFLKVFPLTNESLYTGSPVKIHMWQGTFFETGDFAREFNSKHTLGKIARNQSYHKLYFKYNDDELKFFLTKAVQVYRDGSNSIVKNVIIEEDLTQEAKISSSIKAASSLGDRAINPTYQKPLDIQPQSPKNQPHKIDADNCSTKSQAHPSIFNVESPAKNPVSEQLIGDSFRSPQHQPYDDVESPVINPTLKQPQGAQPMPLNAGQIKPEAAENPLVKNKKGYLIGSSLIVVLGIAGFFLKKLIKNADHAN